MKKKSLMKQHFIGRSVFPTSSLLSRSLKIMMIMLFSCKISSSFNCIDSYCDVENKHQDNDELIQQQNEMMVQEHTNISTIGKWGEKEDQKHEHNYINDKMTSDAVALTHRMTQECVNDENKLRSAVSNAPNRSSLISTDILICKEYIAINSEINILIKDIRFSCGGYYGIFKKCTIDSQKKSRHFNINNSIISFKEIIFINGNGSGSDDDGGSLRIDGASTIDIIECDFNDNEVTLSNFGGLGVSVYVKRSISKLVDTTMTNNKAYKGGAIYLEDSNANMINSGFTYNLASWVSGYE